MSRKKFQQTLASEEHQLIWTLMEALKDWLQNKGTDGERETGEIDGKERSSQVKKKKKLGLLSEI